MRAIRLLSMLLLLQNRGRMSAAQLAAELGVSARTVYRDVEALAAVGVPIYAEQGPTGGYELMDGYRTRLTGLTADEAESLFLTGMPQTAAELGLGAQVAAAELKLTAALPTPYRATSTRIRQRVHLDTPGWYRRPDEVPHLLAVAEALWRDQAIDIRYHRWSPSPGVVSRRLHPLGLVLKAGVWYLVASSGDQPRTYRVSAIAEAIPLDEEFARPSGFDLAQWWQAHVQAHERAETASTAVVRMSPNALGVLSDMLGPLACTHAMRTITPPDQDGWHQVTIPLESVPHAAAALLRLGAEAQALAPPELVTHMSATVRAMTSLYPQG